MSEDVLREGELAPDFELEDDAGRRVRLSALRGRPVVLFFYPEDDTPGCTEQACSFRDVHREFESFGAAVFGVSADPAASHREFRKKHALPYPLLVDPGNAVAARYGAFGPKQMYGREVVGTIRSSVVVGPDGRVLGVFRNVRTAGNGERTLEFARKALAAKR